MLMTRANLVPLLMTVLAFACLLTNRQVSADPYLGTPFKIGLHRETDIVYLKNYDTGGQDVGYHDNTPGNLYGAYRNDDVDIVDGINRHTYVADTQVGEWL